MSYLNYKRNSLEICMNLRYDNRVLIGDDPKNFSDYGYGSSSLGDPLKTAALSHGTKVSGVLASTVKALGDSIKLDALSGKNYPLQILPVVISSIGDPMDKDLYLGIRYAISHGVKIINLSQSKQFSLNDSLIDQAFNYAREHDVLIVKSAGNNHMNLDDHYRFPDSFDNKNGKYFDNVITVSATEEKINSKLKSKSANYGKNTVDLFAPGAEIKTLLPNNKLTFSGGTSYAAPIVASVAALIRSYYPSLKASQVKDILMKSVTSFDTNVEIVQEDGTKKMVPFSELSKSGGVVNAYNAMRMAEKMAEK